MTDLEFVEDLPPYQVGSRSSEVIRRDRIVEQLQANPGRWARVETRADNKRPEPYRNRGCEVATRTIRDDVGTFLGVDTYARWPDEVES